MNTNSIPTEAVAIYNQALEFSNKMDYLSAISKYRQAICIYPAFIEAYNNIGEIHSRMGNTDQALETYREALKIRRNHKLLLNIGVEYYNRGEYREGLSYFLDSLYGNDGYLEGNLYAALAYYSLKDTEMAEKFFLEVIRYDQYHLKANYLLSTIYYERKDYERTLGCLENIRETYEDKSFINKYYGFCCYFTGRYKDAVKYLTDALESQPKYRKFKTFLESLTYENKLKEIRNIDGEIKDLEEKLAREIWGIKDYTKLSMLYIFKGKNSKAEKLLLEARERLAS